MTEISSGTDGISLEGQVALVTGSSRGIGAVVARRMARAGARVALNYNASLDAAIEVREQIFARGGNAMLIAGDVSDESQAEQAIKAVVRGIWPRGYPGQQRRHTP